MATPRSSTAPVVRARAWTSSGFSPLVIYTEASQQYDDNQLLVYDLLMCYV